MNLGFDEKALVEFAKQVELVATRVLEGLHRSRRGGEGVEFHSALPFSQGEDVRRIDWKRYAASDRLYVRKFQREERAAWSIVLDSSLSMNYGEKANWSRLWSACICFLANHWGDTWKLGEYQNLSLSELFRGLLEGDLGADPSVFHRMDLVPKSHVVIVSDFFFDLTNLKIWLESLESFESINFVQVITERERNFPFEGVLQFLDLESKDKLTLDARIIRKRYQAAFQEHQSELKSLFPSANYQLSFVENSPVEEHLVKFYETL